jgi:hypothetical protein
MVSTCVISQPRFFPGLHYLHRMMMADIFVILDTVQFTPRHEENRARVKGPSGPQWLTIPMNQSSREQRIQDTRIDQTQAWQRKAIGTLHNLYRDAPCYTAYAPEIVEILGRPLETLSQLDRASWEPALRLLQIDCQFVNASDLPVTGRGQRLLLEICQCLGANVYLSGGFGRDYLDVAAFAEAGIDLKFHEYGYPVYPQLYGEFVPFLSYLDTLFNVGLDRDIMVATGDLPIPPARTDGSPAVVPRA